jgi:hypothetical protein
MMMVVMFRCRFDLHRNGFRTFMLSMMMAMILMWLQVRISMVVTCNMGGVMAGFMTTTALNVAMVHSMAIVYRLFPGTTWLWWPTPVEIRPQSDGPQIQGVDNVNGDPKMRR